MGKEQNELRRGGGEELVRGRGNGGLFPSNQRKGLNGERAENDTPRTHTHTQCQTPLKFIYFMKKMEM